MTDLWLGGGEFGEEGFYLEYFHLSPWDTVDSALLWLVPPTRSPPLNDIDQTTTSYSFKGTTTLVTLPWVMDPTPGDDEAPRDPGALKIHQPSYTDEDFEGEQACVFRIVLNPVVIQTSVLYNFYI
ncbi:hypothetical protein RUM43_008685 [Polyplax serrata]|uniref:Uncharacterized protein n=1 Tax=Polyplax serrata TaxID=468196 RepID=A0AAN8NUQ7_POLSC